MNLSDQQKVIDRHAADRADWLVDAIATTTQDRRFLRGSQEEDRDLIAVVRLNGEKAIRVAVARALKEIQS